MTQPCPISAGSGSVWSGALHVFSEVNEAFNYLLLDSSYGHLGSTHFHRQCVFRVVRISPVGLEDMALDYTYLLARGSNRQNVVLLELGDLELPRFGYAAGGAPRFGAAGYESGH